MDIYKELNTYYHSLTLSSEWSEKNGKLDEIQTFIQFLKNENKLKDISFDDFKMFFEYKEEKVNEPGDVLFFRETYQITHGNTKRKSIFEKHMSYQRKTAPIKNGIQIFESISLVEPDVAMNPCEQIRFYLKDRIIKQKEKKSNKNISLLVRFEHRDFGGCLEKIPYSTKWKEVIFVFSNKNFYLKKDA